VSGALLLEPLLSRLVGRPVDFDELDARLERCFGEHVDAGARAADLEVYLPDDLLVKMDRASMASSLETRAPFLTPALCAWALSLPTGVVGPPGHKALPRQLAAEVLPAGLSELPKQGFSVPMATWLRGPLAPQLAEVLAPSELARDGLLDPEVVGMLRARLEDGRRGVAGALWALLVLQRWRQAAR
jgi:asparagine synthase (glutamine-hydrolysing)